MKKLDLKKELKRLYRPSAKKVEVVNVPQFNFAMIDGQFKMEESPETSPDFQDALRAVYGVAYTLKFMSKLRQRNPIDYPVMALEGLWWAESGEFNFAQRKNWRWTLMIMQPRHITAKMYQAALEQLKAKKDNPALARLRWESFREGLCIQIMHVGPYSEEPRTIERLKTFARESGYTLRGKHHEIYLGDPRRARPEKLQTVLRYPVAKGPTIREANSGLLEMLESDALNDRLAAIQALGESGDKEALAALRKRLARVSKEMVALVAAAGKLKKQLGVK